MTNYRFKHGKNPNELDQGIAQSGAFSNNNIHFIHLFINQINFIMKKKVFSLMMTLVLAFMGMARAEVVEIGDGTGTTYYFPIDNYYNY
ncbi:MAG: hypothetical protein IJ057_02425, partial [Bacteroidales bacterium]|nr:hypothetical protein [Bacteroidales bacterium]